MKISDIVLNPIRMRIIQLAITKKQVTTSELLQQLPDIPRTTLYRHVKELVDNEILVVTKTNKVRGQIERVMVPNMEWWNKENSLENADTNFYQILMGLYGRCHEYFNQENPTPEEDRLFINHMVMMLSDEEMDQFVSELKELFMRYQYPMKEGRKARDFTFVSAPDSN